MKKILWSILISLLAAGGMWADEALFKNADTLHDTGQYKQEYTLLEGALSGAGDSSEKGELYWRLARANLEIVDQEERDGVSKGDLLAGYNKSIDFANKSLKYEPGNYNAYYWRSANTGRWGETKGILNSLFKAPSMRDDLEKAINNNPRHGDSYYVLGRLYYEVPGFISFGNVDYAVSLARKAIDNQEKKVRPYHYSYYLALGKDLVSRKWSASKRLREQKKKVDMYSQKKSLLEKNWYYEGTVDFSAVPPYSSKPLAELSDREEARDIMKWLKEKLSTLPHAKPGDMDDLKEVKEILAKM